MSQDDTTLFRLNQIDDKLSSIDERFNSIESKLDALKTDLLSSRCSAPNTCLILKMQMDGFSSTLERINSRLDAHDKKVEEHEKDLANVKMWQRVAIYGFSIIGGITVFFKDQIINLFSYLF